MDQNRYQTILTALFSNSAVDLKSNFSFDIKFEELLEIIHLDKEERSTFRASWFLEHLALQQRVFLTQFQQEILALYISINNFSALRSISKLVIEIQKSLIKNKSQISEDVEEQIINKTFDLLANQDCPVALRCNVYDIVFNFHHKHKWVLSELKTQIIFDLEKHSTPALKSRGLRILHKLE